MKYLIVVVVVLLSIPVFAQSDLEYLNKNAVVVNNPKQLSDSVYDLLSPYKSILFGEMHGTNESAPFVYGLATLFAKHGDSVLVGLEIPSQSMNAFKEQNTDGSIFQSDFFAHPPYQSGKESVAWAQLISKLKNNALVKLFFFDINTNDPSGFRDSLMYQNIKNEQLKHPNYKLITLSGNYHNRLNTANNLYDYFIRDTSSSLSKNICTLNMEYKEGSANANFNKGLEIKQLGSYPSIYNSQPNLEKYLLLFSNNAEYQYNGFYFVKTITPASMTGH
jgi:hypothetical protein